MSISAQHAAHATSLLADIHSASATFLPRREELELWLRDFLRRSAAKGFHVAGEDVENLNALDQFVRAHHLPVAAV